MPVTMLVEPDPGGHHFQAVAHVARVAGQTDDIVLLTTAGAAASEEFTVYLHDVPLTVEERFTEMMPPTREIARVVAELCRERAVATVVVLDGDKALLRWWYDAAREFRGLAHKPRVVFFLTRYPTQLGLADRAGWKLRIAKATLSIAAMVTGTLHRVSGFAGREDMTPGWLVKRARDPAICTAHSRDRDRLRAELGLAADRKIVGIFGTVNERKNAPLILDAMTAADVDADLLLAGELTPGVQAWVDALPEGPRRRLIVRDGFLSNDLLDRLVASADVAPLALTHNGPSGIMGKALAAGVPVVTAGSMVRARELRATGAGEVADEFTAESIGAAINRVFSGAAVAPQRSAVPPATADAFAATVLGVDEHATKADQDSPGSARSRSMSARRPWTP